ncbi:hypothetical protein OR1_02220 [Geobacter sp. OR-1]|uniref:hypothetical protein n=1 Tax=Geobacter sp. OR-1 TaxID=1266765 RepID=UPI000541ACF4|nr:hypothetical protein [Geobacter sp. OR-1]GAM09936.1 hypothetical protein OR1_02220 [Geobacter sp. OR-1]
MNLQIDENYCDLGVWSPLFAVLKADRLPRFVFNEMLRFVNPPPKIESSFAIFENLATVFNYFTAILNAYSRQGELVKQVANWERYCLVIISRRNEINNSLPKMFNSSSKTDVPPFHSYYESHPLGVALWCSPSNPAELHRYRLLQAYLCLSIYKLMLLENQNPYLHKNAKILACRAVRKLAHSEHAKILSALPLTVVTLEEYRHAFIRFVKDEEFQPLIALFNLALGLTQGKEKGKGGGKRNQNPFKKPRQTVEFGDDDEPAKRERIDVITYTKGSIAEQKARKKSLCAPDEFESAQEFLDCSEPGPDPSGGLSPGQQYIIAKMAASAIALHNQRLATDWDQLTSHEIGVFLKELKRLAIRDDDICGVKSQELATFLAIVFWTSASTKTAANTVRVPAAAACEAALGICWSSEQDATWVIKPFVPRLKLVPKSILEAQALPLAVRFTIDIPTEATAIIGRRLNKMNPSFRSVRIFHSKPADLEQAADHFFSDLRHREGGRQSLQRISGCLHSLLTRMPGSDITAAMSITGKNDPLGVVPVHYTANEIERLKGLYRCACFELANAHAPEAAEAKENSADSTEPVKAKYYVGSRFVPKEKVVTKLVLDLRERIEKAREVYRDNGDPVQLHNDLTVYRLPHLQHCLQEHLDRSSWHRVHVVE